jgi:hypothetical protein
LDSFRLNKVYTYIGFVVLLLCTYFRENILLEINALLALKEYDRSFSYWFISFFKSVSLGELIYWKWGITLFFTILMSIVTIFSLHNWFKERQNLKVVVLIYFISFLSLVIIGGVGYLFNSFEIVYVLLRKVLGVIQSPLPFICFLLLFRYKNK